MPPIYPQGLCSFPGLRHIVSATATIAHGISPSAIQVVCAPQSTPVREGGPFEITFGPDVTIRWEDCKIDSGSFARNDSGQIVSLAILDRRWKWRFGAISGAYNLREKDGKIVKNGDLAAAAVGNAFEDTERTPKELAELCLEAMGEEDYDIDDLPDDQRPPRQWEYDNPAEALQSLCDELGCRVVLQLDNRVAIRRIGEKAGGGIAGPVPDGPFMDGSQSLDPPERPDAIVIVTAPVRYQVDLPLEAVGQDVDGKIKPIDELSYNPRGQNAVDGWANIDLPSFLNIDDTLVPELGDVKLRDLAAGCIFRWYRIKPPFFVPGFDEEITKRSQVLPLESEMVDTNLIEGVKENRPARVFGIFFNQLLGSTTNNATTLKPIADAFDKNVAIEDFSIDAAKGIVKFSQPVWKLAGAALNVYAPAELRLRTAVSIKNKDTGAFIRYERKRDSNAGTLFGTKARYIRHDEIIPTKKTTYDQNTYAIGPLTENTTEIDEECDYYLDAAEQEYKTNDPTEARYAGIKPVELDGSIQSVTFSIGNGPATTAVSRNQDQGSATTVPYKLRRQAEKNNAVAAAANNARGGAAVKDDNFVVNLVL